MNMLTMTPEQYEAHQKRVVGARMVVGRAGIHTPAKQERVVKYRNRRVEEKGMKFDSMRERDRYRALALLRDHRKIENLEHHVMYVLEVNGVRIGAYECDFRYVQNGETIVEDIKPKFKNIDAQKRYYATQAYRMFKVKKLLMLAVHGIEVREV